MLNYIINDYKEVGRTSNKTIESAVRFRKYGFKSLDKNKFREIIDSLLKKHQAYSIKFIKLEYFREEIELPKNNNNSILSYEKAKVVDNKLQKIDNLASKTNSKLIEIAQYCDNCYKFFKNISENIEFSLLPFSFVTEYANDNSKIYRLSINIKIYNLLPTSLFINTRKLNEYSEQLSGDVVKILHPLEILLLRDAVSYLNHKYKVILVDIFVRQEDGNIDNIEPKTHTIIILKYSAHKYLVIDLDNSEFTRYLSYNSSYVFTDPKNKFVHFSQTSDVHNVFKDLIKLSNDRSKNPIINIVKIALNLANYQEDSESSDAQGLVNMENDIVIIESEDIKNNCFADITINGNFLPEHTGFELL